MLLTYGVRGVLRSAVVAVNAGREVCDIRQWALAVQQRTNHHKAACALVNKLTLIC
jgi:transposase